MTKKYSRLRRGVVYRIMRTRGHTAAYAARCRDIRTTALVRRGLLTEAEAGVVDRL